MNPSIFNPVPILLTLCAMSGVLVHDSRLDRAAASALPAQTSAITSLEELKVNDLHTHAERVSFTQNVAEPSIQPRNDNDKKYVVQKKLTANTFGSVYIWPSS